MTQNSEELRVKSSKNPNLHSALYTLNSRGSVLIWVIWSLVLLAIFTVAINRQVTVQLTFGRWLMDHVLTRGLAKAGIQRVLYELKTEKIQTFDAGNENWSANPDAFRKVKVGNGEYSVICNSEQGPEELETGFRYGACDESARLNLNMATEDMLKNLLKAVDPNGEEKVRTEIAQAIIDWRDEDDSKQTQGAENNEYKSLRQPYEVRNGPLQSVEELLMIRGVTPEIYKMIRPYVTVYTEGPVNFNTAPVKVLQALGLNEALAERIAEYRLGGDGKEGTKDDEVFQEPASITSTFSVGESFSSEEYAQLSNAIGAGTITVRSNVFRIYSIGRLIRGSRTLDDLITCVVRRDGQILYWKEGRT